MKSSDETGITFANLVVGRGVFNGVVNVSLAAFQFSANGDKVEADPAITARIRMDIPCARALHEALGQVLAIVDAPPAIHGTPPADVDAEPRKTESLN